MYPLDGNFLSFVFFTAVYNLTITGIHFRYLGNINKTMYLRQLKFDSIEVFELSRLQFLLLKGTHN